MRDVVVTDLAAAVMEERRLGVVPSADSAAPYVWLGYLHAGDMAEGERSRAPGWTPMV